MSETWVINEVINPDFSGNTFAITFVSNGITFNAIELRVSFNVDLYYDSTQVYITYKQGSDWTDQAYRTVTFPTAPTGDLLTWLQANAVKQVTGYSITFHANEGVPTPQNLTDQTELPTLPIISKTNYNFVGWYYDSTFTQEAHAGDTLSANVDLYAKFTALPTNITLDLSTLGLPEGTHVIQFKLSDDGATKRDSELSNGVTYTVGPSPLPQLDAPANITAQGTTIYFDEVDDAESYEVFANGVSIGECT